jgi:hypothetical protein
LAQDDLKPDKSKTIKRTLGQKETPNDTSWTRKVFESVPLYKYKYFKHIADQMTPISNPTSHSKKVQPIAPSVEK